MSEAVSKWAVLQTCNGRAPAKSVLMLLGILADEHDCCSVSVAEIAQRAHYTEHTVCRALESLVAQRLVFAGTDPNSLHQPRDYLLTAGVRS
jgi:DNA-binding MarR family transcriptional regulator